MVSRLVFGIETFDPATYVLAPLVLGATARRASRVYPVAALRAD